jgi:hypothetical protein
MPIQRRHAKRNLLRRHFSPQDRIRICRTIRRHLEIEAGRADTAKRNARLRMAIGLPPFRRRTFDRELCR